MLVFQFWILACLPALGCSIIKVVCDMMTEFANECFIACYSQSQNVATMKYSVVQVKDKLLEAWFMKYLPIVCGLNNDSIFPLFLLPGMETRKGTDWKPAPKVCSRS